MKMKLAVLSNINIDPLKNLLHKNGFSDLYFGGYNQWQSELLSPDSGLSAFSPDFIFIYLNLDEFQADTSDLSASVETFFGRNKNASILISNVSYSPYSVLTYSEDRSSYESELNDELNRFAAQNDRIFILDFNRIIRLYGYKTLFDDKFWYLGRIKFSNQGFMALAQELKNFITCLLGKSKKVLIVDLDNTLWGGIVGEDGLQSILVSREGAGRVFYDLQKKLKQLQQTGVLLAICSKNNEQDAKEVFNRHPDIQLSWDDFVAHKVNWDSKSENIIQIAEALNLGLDSMVFLDDNPTERELIEKTLPDVAVPGFPKDTAQLNQWFVTEVVYPFFAKRKLTQEDAEKTAQYKRNVRREEIKVSLSYDEFIQQLDIKLNIFTPDEDLAFRMAQLTQKTNQFNLTGKRYTETEIKEMLKNPNYELFVCEYEDKFGQEGIVGCAIIRKEKGKAIIDNFLLSCRVLGRRVEFLFLEKILLKTKNQTDAIESFYVETARNMVAKDFYEKIGFRLIEKSDSIYRYIYDRK